MTDYMDQINQASLTEELHSPVADVEDAIIVNVETRDFTIDENFHRIIGVVDEHNSEVVSFKITRYVEHHDISECAEHKVFWRNVDTQASGYYLLKKDKDIHLSDDESAVILGWKIDKKVTAAAGNIEFALQILDYGSDLEVTYELNTRKGQGLEIVEGFEGKGDVGIIPEPRKVGVVVSDTQPEFKNVLWFDTSGKNEDDTVVARTLSLTDEEQEVMTETEAGTYGVSNIQSAENGDGGYDYILV